MVKKHWDNVLKVFITELRVVQGIGKFSDVTEPIGTVTTNAAIGPYSEPTFKHALYTKKRIELYCFTLLNFILMYKFIFDKCETSECIFRFVFMGL
jgi:hypothetical protein